MIENGELDPPIVVTPTFYPPGNTDNGVPAAAVATRNFHNELMNDLIPAVEGTYSTYVCHNYNSGGLDVSKNAPCLRRVFYGISYHMVLIH